MSVQMDVFSMLGSVATWFTYPDPATRTNTASAASPDFRLTAVAYQTFGSQCERNARLKTAIATGPATTWMVSIVGSQGWFTTANGSSVATRYFMPSTPRAAQRHRGVRAVDMYAKASHRRSGSGRGQASPTRSGPDVPALGRSVTRN